MPRIAVVDDCGRTFWNERVTAADFETEHFRTCLADRLSWAVADAEAAGEPEPAPRLTLVEPPAGVLRAGLAMA